MKKSRDIEVTRMVRRAQQGEDETMDIKRCANGHFYDAETNASCPQCTVSGTGAGYGMSENEFYGADDYGATEPAFHGIDNYGATEPAFGGAGNYGATEPAFGGADDYGATEPAFGGAGNYGATEPASKYGAKQMGTFGNQGPTEPFTVAGGNLGSRTTPLQEYDATQMVYMNGVNEFTPVVGWLVAIEGAERGNDYRIRAGYNYVGRGEFMDICIRGDKSISRNKHAVLIYDYEEKVFLFGPVEGKSLIRLNNKLILSPQELKPYDILTIGTTKLMFVPLCGEGFNWDNV